MPRNNLVQVRRGLKTEWQFANPVLANGEIGFEIDSNRIKIGNNISNWNELNYIGLSENIIQIKNDNGYALYTGQAVYFSGYDPSLDIPLVSPYISNNTISEKKFAGIISSYMPNGNIGYVITNGILSNIDTSGGITNFSIGEETWLNGDIIYVSQHNSGKLTKFKPTYNSVVIGLILYSNTTNGSILIRCNSNQRLSELNEISFTNSLLDNSLIKYDNSTQTWKNSTEIDGGMV